MAANQNFRSAFNGFNREDVVNYISQLSYEFDGQLNRVKGERAALQQDLELAREQCADAAQLRSELEEAKARNAFLEQEIAALRQQQEVNKNNDELEAYRRAERAERKANTRVAQMYANASGILADATACTDATAQRVGELTNQICQQLSQLQNTLTEGADAIRGSAAAMYALKPADNEE